MEIRRHLARTVQRLRAERGWSQEDLAEESGLHRTYISGIERGIRNPTLTVLETLAKGLKVAPADLLPNR